MIVSFGDRATEDLFHGRTTNRTSRFPKEIASVALRKMDMVNAASLLSDLRSPPGNRLEALGGHLKGSYSVRVNDQWRLVFRWKSGQVLDLKLMDYH